MTCARSSTLAARTMTGRYINRILLETRPSALWTAPHPIACRTKRARICASMRTTLSTGIPGVRRLWKKRAWSAGRSCCHWSHVMAHEAFEDADTARLMNELFVNIKVDREERPDIDRIYQIAQQMLTQRNGGWPLTMFLSHEDQRPFFGGTYFPSEARHGMPAFT